MNLFLKNRTKILNILFYILLTAIILIGIYSRTKYYLSGTPLWLDEVLLGCNFSDMNISDIFFPLEGHQKSPPLFVFGVFVCRSLFGMSELSLRFLPYISGSAALILFSLFVKKHVNNKFGVLAGAYLFAFCIPLIYMCGELKQYEFDVFITVVLMCLYRFINLNNLNLKKTVLYCIAAGGIVLSSFSALFTIPAIILSKIINYKIFDKRILWIFATITITGLYLYFYDTQTYNFMVNYWDTENGFGIKFIPAFIPDACKYFIYNFNTGYVAGIVMFILCGSYVLYKENRDLFCFFACTLLMIMIASTAYIYPFKPKLCIFLFPIFAFIIAKSFDVLTTIKNEHKKFILNIILSVSLFIIYGLYIPYFNMTENRLTYYNKTSNGRDKSVENRKAVKSYSKILLTETADTDKILASEEFLFSTKLYQHSFKSPKLPSISTYEGIERKDFNKYIESFIEKELNTNNALWFAGRDKEYFFKCAEFQDIENIIRKYNLKYNVYRYNDLYIIHVIK